MAPLIVPAINGPIVAFLTELAKRAPAVPFEAKTVTTLIIALGALSTLTTVFCNLAIAWLSGNILAFDFAGSLKLVGQVVLSVLTAAGAFGMYRKGQKVV
jgi:hypothetical protein